MYAIEKRVQYLEGVAGQSTIVKALRNLIQSDSIPKVSLFLGPAGCGKTTLGQILAATLTCHNLKTDDLGRLNPCTKCPACRSISTQTSSGDFYVYNGALADDAEQIEIALQYAPNRNRVFLINELHDSSSKALDKFKAIFEKNVPNNYFIITSSDVEKFRDFVPGKSNQDKVAISSRLSSTFSVKSLQLSIIREKLFEVLNEYDPNSEIPDSIFDVISLIADNSKSNLRTAYNSFELVLNSQIYTPEEAQDLLGFENNEKEMYKLLLGLANKETDVLKYFNEKKYETVYYYMGVALSNILEAEITGYDNKEKWQINNAKDIVKTGELPNLIKLFESMQSTLGNGFNETLFKIKLYDFFNKKLKVKTLTQG
jgi:DNA polymerase III gamma/tau subunit